jgi:hypothetical protein
MDDYLVDGLEENIAAGRPSIEMDVGDSHLISSSRQRSKSKSHAHPARGE